MFTRTLTHRYEQNIYFVASISGNAPHLGTKCLDYFLFKKTTAYAVKEESAPKLFSKKNL